MQNSTQQAFEELFRDHENNYCFECGAPSNHWASVNNGVFLCINCSGLHRGFGVNISFVRSVNMDSWSELQLAMMRNGGNARLRSFFENYRIPKDGPIDFKYKTKAGAYYREMLKALSEGRPLPNPPSHEEGLELLGPKTNTNSGDISGFGSAPAQNENGLDKVVNFMGSAVSSTTQKVQDPEFQENVKQGVMNFGSSVATGAKGIATKVRDPAFQEDVKAFGGKVATGTKEVAGKVADKSKEIWANKDEYIQKTSEVTMAGITSAIGFFKKWGSNTGNNQQQQ